METNLFDLFDLLIKPTNHIISRVRNFFNFHEVDQRINFAWQDQMKNIAVIAESNSSWRGNLCDINTFINVNNVLPLRMNLKAKRNKKNSEQIPFMVWSFQKHNQSAETTW